MRIKKVRLKNYKRFTELTIADLPETARLVVLVGPNGTGKSSVLDSFPAEGQNGRQQPKPHRGHGAVLREGSAIQDHP